MRISRRLKRAEQEVRRVTAERPDPMHEWFRRFMMSDYQCYMMAWYLVDCTPQAVGNPQAFLDALAQDPELADVMGALEARWQILGLAP